MFAWLLLGVTLFPTQITLPAQDPVRVAIARLDPAGPADLVVLTQGGTGIVFRRDGKAFRGGAPFPAGNSPNDLAVADLDGDGKADLAIANHEQKHVTLLLGDGRGGFKPAPGSPLPADVAPHTHSLAVADFDRDGKPDLALNDMGGKRALLLWGGAFAAATGVPTGSAGHAYLNVVAADLNGDGAPDLVLPSWPRGQIAVLLGDGKRGFRPAPGSPLETANPAFYAAVADFDGDGRLDIAVATYSGSSSDASRDSVVLFSGDGRSGFGAPRTYTSGRSPTSLAAGDVDGDGIADLAVCNQSGDSVTVFLGGKGGLRPGATLAVPHPVFVALGDLDGDGKADLAVASAQGVLVFLTR
jgi:hypothetical protein